MDGVLVSDLSARLRTRGLEVPEDAIWTSALAAARFLDDQRPGGSAYVIGEVGLTTALHQAGYTLTDRDHGWPSASSAGGDPGEHEDRLEARRPARILDSIAELTDELA